MAIYCTRCTYDNPAQSGFCIRCGATLQGGGNTYSATSMSGQAPFSEGASGGQNQQQTFTVANAPSAQASQALAPPTSGLGSLRRAFAGHGTLIKHHSWLLNGQQSNASAIRQAIMDKIGQRNLDNLNLNQENLTDRSVVEERRDYIKVKRKVTTVFIYVARAGHDLYISRATTVLPAFSLLRTIALGVILLAIFLPLCNIIAGASALTSGISATSGPVGPGYPSSPSGPSSIAAAGAGLVLWVAVMFFFGLPAVWILVIALGRSIASFILDKDMWVLLRPNTLTEFQRDDVALLEHETDDIVRDALKQLGMDADKIVPPSDGYQAKTRIRLI